METLAYLHLCTAHEKADLNPGTGELKLFEGVNWQTPCSAWIHFTSIVMALSILSLASGASAYTARVRTNGSELNVRTGPGLDHQVTEALPNGTPIRLNGNRSDGWLQLSRLDDWVSANWINRGSSRSSAHSYSSTTKVVYRSEYSPYVAKLQQRLKNLSYFKSRVTGFYGPATETALRDFQKNNQLPQDGILEVLNPGSVQITKSPGTTPNISSSRTLQFGSKGQDVATIQQRLKNLGYFKGRITGSYDRTTEAAVKQFQQYNGDIANGIADSLTQQQLVASA